MVWPAIGLGLAQAGLSYFGQKSQADAQRKAYKKQVQAQRAMADASRNFQNLQIRKGNEYRKKIWDAKVGIYNQQIALNQQAANRAFDAAQINRNRQLQAFAFQLEGRHADLLETVGYNTASMEGENRSAELASAKMTYGRFGRMRAQDFEQIKDINVDTERSMGDIATEQYKADLNAWSQVAVPPMMQDELPPNMWGKIGGPSGMNTGLMIGTAFMSGLSTFNAFKPPSAGNIGSGGGGGLGQYMGFGGSNFSSKLSNVSIGSSGFK